MLTPEQLDAFNELLEGLAEWGRSLIDTEPPVEPPVDPVDPPDPPVDPPPAEVPTLVGLAAVAQPGAVKLMWSNTSEVLPISVNWGSGGWLGKQSLAPSTDDTVVPNLDPAKNYTFDVGYVKGPTSRVTCTPLPTGAVVVPPYEPPVDPPIGPGQGTDDGYPMEGNWDAKKEFIRSRAGVTTAARRLVTSQADLAALKLPGTWLNSIWTLPRGGLYTDLDVAGLVIYEGQEPLAMTNVAAQGIQYNSKAGKVGGRFQHCTITRNARQPLGQGGINFYGQQGWLVDNCDISGFSDGIQCVGPGTISDCYFHHFVMGITASGIPTHNDGVQNYRGLVTVLRSWFTMGGKAGSTNGCLFNSTPQASFIAKELIAEVDLPNVNCLHAWDSTINVIGGYIRGGRLIGKVSLVDCIRIA